VTLLLAAIVGLVASAIVTRWVEVVARRRSLLDLPIDRSLHSVPTPRLGGIGIVAGSLVAVAVTVVVGGGAVDGRLAILGVAGLFLAAVGLVDDLRHISVPAKYGAQLVAALVAAWTLSPTLEFELARVGWSIGGPIALAATVIWITALVNAFNFMDGIDGMAGGIAVIVMLAGMQLTGTGAHAALVAVAAGSVGFLVWNIHPARIFMGDVGSQYLGYWAAVALLIPTGDSVEVVPILLLTAPILFDTGLTLSRRARAGKNIFAGHREHLYQRLTLAGVGARTVSLGYAAATGLCGLLAIAYASAGAIGQVASVIGVLLAGVVYATAIGRLAERD
jgi:UDP-N-acetylmuramyl pentapeptide phosphotransferase/UDP-N-acetylglucosamine-1-phosphate transferase